jgi:pyrimidine-specific ribonucleoside hydrolase
MDGPKLPESKFSVTGLDAVEWIYKTIFEQSSPVTIVATGPLTNIANLLSHYPSVKNRIERIAMMGGSLYSGNITSQAEFNIYVDPQAAKVVFASGIPITMSGLEVCHQAMILHRETERFNTDGKASKLTFELLEFYSRFAKHLGQSGSPLFDLCPVVELLISADLFTSVDLFVDVEIQGELTRGKTVGDVRGWADKSKVNAKVLVDVDRQAFIDVFVENARILDREG